MSLLITIAFFAVAGWPLLAAWRANRRTTLSQALCWAWAAWAAWGLTAAADVRSAASADGLRYLALSLTGCAGVAVLGARRPGVGAWNFVVFGLLAVMLLPLAEGLISGGSLHLAGPRVLFLSGTLGVIVLNYLPTKLGAAAVCLGFGCTLQLLLLAGPESLAERLHSSAPWLAIPALAAAPLGHFSMRRKPVPASVFDAVWLDFRDRFGLLWGQRMREQFNRSAANAGWPVYLRWRGLRLTRGAMLPPPALQVEMVAVLRALLQRFAVELPHNQ